MQKNMTFSIVEFGDSDWLSYIDNHPEAHLFHHPIWLGFLEKCYGYHPYLALVRNEEQAIVAGVPFMEINGLGSKRRWISLPFTDHCPPLYTSMDALLELEEGLINEARSKKVTEMELRWAYSAPGFFQSSEHVLTKTQLYPDPARVLEGIKGNDFRKVKLGPKRGIEVEKATSLDAMKTYYGLHLETRRRLGVPIQPWRFFQLMSEELIQRGMGFISLARQDEEYLAGIVFLMWKKTLIYKFAASSQKGRQLAASYPITWDAITWGCENQYEIFDWGRSDADDMGLRDFKNRWASEEKGLVYSRDKNEGVSLLAKVKPLVKTVISRSPGWVCRLSGELLYRYFA